MKQGTKTKVLWVMIIATMMVCQSLKAQNEAIVSEQADENIQKLIIGKKDYKIGLLEDTIELSYVYKEAEPDEATHKTHTINHLDTTIIQIININNHRVIDEDMYIKDSLVYNRLYNEAGDSVQVTSYKDLSIKHYQQGRLVRQYKYKGNTRVATLYYPEGPVMCIYTTGAKDTEMHYYSRSGAETTATKPIRLVSDSLLKKALVRMVLQNHDRVFAKKYTIEIKIDTKGHMMGWKNIATKGNYNFYDLSLSRPNQSSIPFTWKPANVDGFGLVGYDTILIDENDFDKLQYKKALTFPQLPKDGTLFYAGNVKTIFSSFDNPFLLNIDTVRYTWSANLQLEPKSKNNQIATVKHNGDFIYFEWAQDGKKFKEEKYSVIDSHTLLLEEEVYFNHDSITENNKFNQGTLVSSVRINPRGDTLSVWESIKGETDSYIYKYAYNVNPYIRFVTQTGSEKNIEYRDKIQNVVRPYVKNYNKCYITIPDSLKNINKVITTSKGHKIEINETFRDTILYAYAMIGEDGSPIGGYELGFERKHELTIPSNKLVRQNLNEQIESEAKLKDLMVQHRKQVLQYVQDELSKFPIEFIPGRIDSNVVALPYVFTITLERNVIKTTSSPADDSDSEFDNVVFVICEKSPQFYGGTQAMYKFLSENIKYPAAARANGVQGRVLCQFIVNKDGSISDVTVVRSVDPILDYEAVRVIKSMPNWKPGEQKGKPVRVSYMLPISFKL